MSSKEYGNHLPKLLNLPISNSSICSITKQIWVQQFEETVRYESSKCFDENKIVKVPGARKYTLAVDAKLRVGDVVVAKVEDIGGPINNPILTLKFKNEEKDLIATLPAKTLTLNQRLALQEGDVVQVSIASIEGENVQVSLKTESGIARKPLPSSERLPRKQTDPQRVQPSRGENIKSVVNSKSATEWTTRPSSERLPRKSSASQSSVPRAQPAGLILKELKTGMKLEGVVSSCAPFAAFIDADVVRDGKGGSYTAVTGMLHHSDLPKNYQFATTKGPERFNFDDDDDKIVLEAGTKITVYVKEVWKNSGRFTVTLDPTIDKAKILEMKRRIKEEGQARRRSRRIRRQLETVQLGDLVTGWVDRVVPEGVLVTIASLGPLNITGLLGTRDFPPQFQFPPDLRESFQKQLLEQDFVTGRQLTASVLKVNPKYNPFMTYNMKLVFEEFTSKLAEKAEVVIPDLLDAEEVGGDEELEDDILDDDDQQPEDSDVREVFDELRGGRDGVPVRDFRDWGDIQDMVAEGDISQKDLDDALSDVGALESDELSFQQFSQVVETLQDVMDGGAGASSDDEVDDEDDDGDNNDENDVEIPKNNKDSKKTSDTKSTNNQKPIAVESNSKPGIVNFETEDDDFNDGEEFGELTEEEDQKMKQEIFDELRGTSKTVSVGKFAGWEEVKEMIAEGILDKKTLDNMVKEVGAGKSGQLTFSQFDELLEKLDEIYEDADEAEEEEDDDNEEGEDVGSEGLTEEEDQKMKQEIFDELRGTSKTVSVGKFAGWEEVKEMIAEGILDKKTLDNMVKEVGAGKSGQLTFSQFDELLEKLNKIFEEADEAEAAEENDNDDDNDDSLEEEDVEMTEDEETEVARTIYNDLRGKSQRLQVKKFFEWDEIQEMLKDGRLVRAELEKEIKNTLGVAKDMDFDSFRILVEKVNDMDKALNDENEIDEMGEGVEDNVKEEGDEEELTAEQELEMRQELFDELRGKAKKVSVKTFKTWTDLQEMIELGAIDMKTVDEAIRGVGARDGELDFTQFISLMDVLNEVVEQNLDSEDKEEKEEESSQNSLPEVDSKEGSEEEEEAVETQFRTYAQDAFDELKNKRNVVPVKKLMQWEGVKDLLDDELIDPKSFQQIVESTGAKMDGDLSSEQTYQILRLLEEKVDEFDEDDYADGDEEEEGDELEETDNDSVEEEALSEDEFREYCQAMYDELRGKKKTVSVDKFKSWDNIQELVESKILDMETIEKTITNMGISLSSGNIDFEQFTRLVKMMDAATTAAYSDMASDDGVADTSLEDSDTLISEEEGEEDSEDDVENALLELYDEMRGKSETVPVGALKAWDELKMMIDEGYVTMNAVDKKLKEVGASRTGRLDYEQFKTVVNMLMGIMDEAMGPEEGDDDNDDGAVVQNSIKSVPVIDTNETKGKSRQQLTAEKVAQTIEERDDEDAVIDKDFLPTAAKTLSTNPGVGFGRPAPLTKAQIKAQAKAEKYQQRLAEEAARASVSASSPTNKMKEEAQLGALKGSKSEDFPVDSVDELTRELFDDLRGSKPTLSVKQFMKWEDVNDMISSGALKRSSLAKALAKIGVDEDGDISFEKFTQLVEILKNSFNAENVSMSLFDEDNKVLRGGDFTSSKGGKVLLVDPENIQEGDDDIFDDEEMEEFSEKDAAKDVYDGLRGDSETLSLVQFLQWEDLQELLDSGALDRDSLALCIENAGVNVDDDRGLVTFDQFFDLINTIEDYIDFSKVPEDDDDLVVEKKLQVTTPNEAKNAMNLVNEMLDDDDAMDDLKVSYVKDGVTTTGEEAIDELERDLEVDDEADMDDKLEVEEMYRDLCNGKKCPSLKDLKNWDELEGLVESNLVTRKMIDTYISRLEIKDESKIDFETFSKFIEMLDHVLVDNSGNLLGIEDEDKAVDLD